MTPVTQRPMGAVDPLMRSGITPEREGDEPPEIIVGPRGIYRPADDAAVAALLGSPAALSLMELMVSIEDVASLLFASSSDAECTRADRSASDIAFAQLREQFQSGQRLEAIELAQRAAQEASKLFGVFPMPQWLQVTITALIMLAATAAALFTGGATLGLAVAALVLMVAAETMNQLVMEGVIEPSKEVMGVMIGLQVAAAVLSIVSGNVGGVTGMVSTGIATAMKVVDVVQKTLSSAGTLLQVLDGGLRIAGAEYERIAEYHEADADEAESRLNVVRDYLHGAQRDLREILRALQELTDQAVQIQETSNEAHLVGIAV